MAYTAESLKDTIRSELADPESPGGGDDSDSLWSDEDIFRYINEVQHMFAEVTENLVDSATAEICAVPVTANDPWVDLDSRIIHIRRAVLNSNNRRMKILKAQDMDSFYWEDDYGQELFNNWETATGTPVAIITDLEANRGRLVNIPTANDTINLTVVRYPLKDIITSGSIVLEGFERRYLSTWIIGVKAQAYMKEDADTFDPGKAQSYQTEFEQRLDKINQKLSWKRRPAGVVEYGGL